MATLPIVVIPHVALSKPAQEIKDIDERIRRIAKQMAESMYRAPGLGLAANQVAELVRLIVMDVDYAYAEPSKKQKKPIFIINPEICSQEGETLKEEGCLSVPEFELEIKRSTEVEVKGVDLEGNPLRIEAEGLLARVLQHEIDHLHGKTLLDHASSLKRTLYHRRLRKKARRDR
jgi:peptide deformylase